MPQTVTTTFRLMGEVIMRQLFIVIVGVILSSHCLAGRPFDTKEKEEIIRGIASEQNKKLPMMLDASTRHDSTLAGPGEKLTYVFTIMDLNVKYENSPAHKEAVRYIHNEIYPSTIRGNCSTPATRKAIDLGITTAYLYRDVKGIYITTTSIDKNLCKTFGL